jgi:hypothetical protein
MFAYRRNNRWLECLGVRQTVNYSFVSCGLAYLTSNAADVKCVLDDCVREALWLILCSVGRYAFCFTFDRWCTFALWDILWPQNMILKFVLGWLCQIWYWMCFVFRWPYRPFLCDNLWKPLSTVLKNRHFFNMLPRGIMPPVLEILCVSVRACVRVLWGGVQTRYVSEWRGVASAWVNTWKSRNIWHL